MCQKKKDKMRTLHILEIISVVLSVICFIFAIVITGNHYFGRKIYIGTMLLANISASVFIVLLFIGNVIKLRRKMVTDLIAVKKIRRIENIVIALTGPIYLFDTILVGLNYSSVFDYGLLIIFNGFILYAILIRMELCKIKGEKLLSVRNLVGMTIGGVVFLIFCIVVVRSWLNIFSIL